MDLVTGWVHPLLKRWAKHIHEPDDGFPSISMMGRIREQGLVGASIRGKHNGTPVRDIPREIREVHQAIRTMPEDMRIVVEARYLFAGSDKAKAQALGMRRQKYYDWLGKAQTWIAATMQARRANGVSVSAFSTQSASQ